MLAYNDKISIFEKYLKVSNTGFGKFICMKINMELNHNLVNNT